jgi:TctA family transporter
MSPIVAGAADVILQPVTLAALLVGTLVGIIVGLAPGLSARSTLLIAIPFCLSLPPLAAGVLLISIHAASHVSGTVPAVLFGAPTSPAEAATTLDGYPMALAGEGSRAIGAIISASAIGGVGGALVLLAFGAIAAAVVSHIGSPEIAALSTGGVLAIALISEGNLAGGIAMGAAGVLLSTVGLSHFGVDPRFAFGSDALYDGIATTAVVAGVIALPELLRIRPAMTPLTIMPTYRGIIDGMIDPFRRAWLTVRSSLIGLVVGITPGIGTNVAVWLSYGHAASTTRPARPFGSGAIEGVIAPEAANGAKEGGALIPTLYLGIPGSSGMAILLAAFSIVGIAVGPSMLTRQPEIPSAIAAAVALSSLGGLLLCFVAAPWMLRLTVLPRRLVIGLALASSVVATYYALPQSGTAVQTLCLAVFGALLAWGGLSRPAFVVGFVIGPVFEAAVLRSATIHGWGALSRPGVIGIAVAFAVIVFLLRTRGVGQPGAGERKSRTSARAAVPLLVLVPIFVAALVISPGYGRMPSLMPMTAAAVGLLAAAWALASIFLSRASWAGRYRLDWRLAAVVVAVLVAVALVGPIAFALLLLVLVIPPTPALAEKAA